MRLFLALDIPLRVKNIIDQKISFLKKTYPQFSWVPKENYHVTLFFFGETDRINLIKKKIDDLVFDQESFNLFTTNIDLFIHKKIVIYLNFSREKRIETLVKKINETFYFFDHKNSKNKKFIPHLTLARAKIPSKQQYFHLKKQLNKTFIDCSFSVNKIILYQSLLGGKTPLYKRLAVFSLYKK